MIKPKRGCLYIADFFDERQVVKVLTVSPLTVSVIGSSQPYNGDHVRLLRRLKL